MAYTKGQIITLDGKEYRIIKLNGSVAEVVGMTNASDSQQFDASSQVYAGSALDTYLNSTFYATLSDKLKAAIVDKTFTQASWYGNASGYPDYSGYYGTSKPGTNAYTISLGSATFGAEITRHVYALSVQDVLDYILDTSITDGQLQNYNLWKMFWNDEVQHTGNPNFILLRDANVNNTTQITDISGQYGIINTGDNVYSVIGTRAAFTVDLDVYFSLWANENFKTVVFKSNAGADAQNADLINFLSANATPSAVTTFDLTSLGLSAGDHTIKVKATATGYADSDFSNSVTYNVVAMPSKGDLITMNVDGSDKQFRVLNVNGKNAEVVAMFNSTDSQQFDASSQVYAGSALDIYLNETYYNTLTATAKAAIVDKTFTQDSWYTNDTGDPDYSGYSGVDNPGTTAYTISLGSATFGAEITRHVYALSVQDVLDYVLDTSVGDGLLQNYNVWKMFWDITTQPPSNPSRVLWLCSADASLSSNARIVAGGSGSMGGSTISNGNSVRPAFTIDLTKISWSPVT